LICNHDARAQLGFCLMCKTVAGAKREFPQRQIFTHKKAVLTVAKVTDSPPIAISSFAEIFENSALK
jgi:hypothetical protein